MQRLTAALAVALALVALTADGVAAHRHKGVLAEQAALLANPPVWPGAAAKMSCGTCNVLVDVIYAAQATNATRAETIALLDAACEKEFPKSPALCEDVVKVAVDELPHIVKAIYELGYNTSQEVCSCLEFCTVECCATAQGPEQVHINWFGPLSQMRVSWTTLNSTAASTVQYGTGPSPSALNQTNAQNEPEWTYTHGGWRGTLHTALMTGLAPATQYWYRVGSAAENEWSEVLTFTTLPAEPESVTFATIGDMGSDWHSDETVQNLIAALDAGKFHAVIHNGDISYADGNEKNWDIFARKLQPVASRVPYMTTAGNHELWWNFTAYKARWGAVMPYSLSNSDNSMWYSFDLGPHFHFVGFNTETWIDTADVSPEQVAWLKADLQSPAAQSARWRVAYAHRPVYCANTDKEQCTDFPVILQAQVESVFRDNDVALVLTAHEHNYQRTWPVYQKQVANMSYDNPSAPTYLVNGAGGNREGETMGFMKPLPEWMAFTETDTGFGLLTVSQPSLSFQFVDNKGPTVVDEFAITKP